MKLLVILGEGGHTTELLNLVDLLGDNYEYCYILAQEDNLSTNRLRRDGIIYKIPRPRGKDTKVLSAIFKSFLATVEAFKILRRVKPIAILSTGPAIAVPISIVGRLLGVKIIFVETGSRVEALSLTGRIMYRWANLFFVQWPQLAEKLPRAIYAGRLV